MHLAEDYIQKVISSIFNSVIFKQTLPDLDENLPENNEWEMFPSRERRAQNNSSLQQEEI